LPDTGGKNLASGGVGGLNYHILGSKRVVGAARRRKGIPPVESFVQVNFLKD